MSTIAHSGPPLHAGFKKEQLIEAPQLFAGFGLTNPESLANKRSTTVAVSLTVHALLVATLIVLPLYLDESVPAPQDAIRAFFVSPPNAAPPPPPPPPPAPGPRVTKHETAPAPTAPARFVAPIEVPNAIKEEPSILELGVEGGVAGGVEGGVPGGVVGGIVGGLPTIAPPPPVAMVRVGGMIKPPRLVQRVNPVYPELASRAGVSAVIVIDAEVGVDGKVMSTKVLRGQPLFDSAAVAAVMQWRYQPLLLNGAPTPFALSITVMFNLRTPESE